MSPKFLLYLAVVAALVIVSAPAAEGTVFLSLCLLRSPLCPFFTTTPQCLTGKTWSPVTKICG
ncbi:PREDICTED: uncharacterized protein LOC108616792 [Drosophila arizonae]|uniref:Uncharacterized protein LOC108616792 n=1 Tax=Drosophila arizonae TaxID=7263 RepID=A0ABM1PKH4_DROAR|nr:PREDICTED: uncharacterized protein LOC108616792 [Drosophila arizonae]